MGYPSDQRLRVLPLLSFLTKKSMAYGYVTDEESFFFEQHSNPPPSLRRESLFKKSVLAPLS